MDGKDLLNKQPLLGLGTAETSVLVPFLKYADAVPLAYSTAESRSSLVSSPIEQ